MGKTRDTARLPLARFGRGSVCPRNRFEQGSGRGQFQPARCASDSSLQLNLHLMGVGLTTWAEHQPKKPRMLRASFALLSEVRGHQVALEVT